MILNDYLLFASSLYSSSFDYPFDPSYFPADCYWYYPYLLRLLLLLILYPPYELSPFYFLIGENFSFFVIFLDYFSNDEEYYYNLSYSSPLDEFYLFITCPLNYFLSSSDSPLSRLLKFDPVLFFFLEISSLAIFFRFNNSLNALSLLSLGIPPRLLFPEYVLLTGSDSCEVLQILF